MCRRDRALYHACYTAFDDELLEVGSYNTIQYFNNNIFKERIKKQTQERRRDNDKDAEGRPFKLTPPCWSDVTSCLWFYYARDEPHRTYPVAVLIK